MNKSDKGISWYFKWAFASYAAAFGLYLLISIVLLPLVGYEFLLSIAGPNGPIYMLALMMITGPIIFKRLK
jgi:hypothetical protein